MFGCIVNFFFALLLFHSKVAEFAGKEYLRSMLMGKVRTIASIIIEIKIVEIVRNVRKIEHNVLKPSWNAKNMNGGRRGSANPHAYDQIRDC